MSKLFIQSIQGFVKQAQSPDVHVSNIKVMDETGGLLPWRLGAFTQEYLKDYEITDKLNLPKSFVCESVMFRLSCPETDLEKTIAERIGCESEDEVFIGDFIYGEIELEEAKRLNKENGAR